MSRKFRIPLLLGLLLIGAVVFAACGDDDDDDDADVTPTATLTVTDVDADADADVDADTATATTTTAADADVDATGVTVSLEDFAVALGVATAGAGDITFEVTNDGATIHNFRIIRTDLAADDLPLDGAVVDEDALDVVGSIGDIAPGETETLAVSLDAGSYVLICNVPGHYQLGMRVEFAVE